MLEMKRKTDIEEMMQYHRTRDMLNLKIYFPSLSPITDMVIVKSMEDYREHIELLSHYPGERNDTLITNPSMKSIEGTGKNVDVLDIFKRVKAIDPDGVMVLFQLCHEPSERYERYAGISVGVSLGKSVMIDAVGLGFDGREVSKGICTHERYKIPWDQLRKCSIETFSQYRTFFIDPISYQKSRQDRIAFLKSLHLNESEILAHVPETYTEIPSFIWRDVIVHLVKELEKMEPFLEMAGFHEFAISGHTEGERYYPWQMFDQKRYGSK